MVYNRANIETVLCNSIAQAARLRYYQFLNVQPLHALRVAGSRGYWRLGGYSVSLSGWIYFHARAATPTPNPTHISLLHTLGLRRL